MRSRSAFTLIELLVVIAIIALLVSILMPSLQKAKEMAKDVVCRSNQRSIVLAMVLYAEEHDDQYPYNTGGSLANWHTLNWAMKIGRIADDPNLMPNDFDDPDPDAVFSDIKEGYRICLEGYIDYNFMSDTEGHFKCPTVWSTVNQKAASRGWSRQFSSSNSVTPRRFEYRWEDDPDSRPARVCVKTTDIRKRAVVIGDCHLKPSGGIDSSVWYDTNFRTTKLLVGAGNNVNQFGPWTHQPWAGAWSRWLPIDFYGHPGDRANLCMTDGSVESVRESDPEDWGIR